MHIYWYREAVIYTLDIRSFKDSNGDGSGDFRGLLEKFDYIVNLGVNCIWLLPFYPSGGKDFGYDVTNYFDVDPQLGTLDDFKELVQKAASHNIKIILDLVVNHTSDQHPWFRDARQNKHSPYYDYYIWSAEKPADDKQDVVFKNVEESNWEYDEEAKQYYYHTFYSFQPDLNIENPKVQKEIVSIIEFWMQTGIAGFRIDAVPHLIRKKGAGKKLEHSFEILNTFKEIVTRHYPDGILVGEADVEPEDFPNYFHGRRVDGIFNFYCNNYLFYSLATKDPKPLIDAFLRLPATEQSECYLNFLRNHDELDLERLTDEEREEVYRVFAPDEDMRIYGRGIRRRLAPMVKNDKRIMELCFSLLLSLPGTPVIRYGEEIGMGDDLRLPERNSVRTAMQWTGGINGGFTDKSDTSNTWPIISEGANGYKTVNVASQLNDKYSLLHCVRQMINIRYQVTPFGHGDFEQLNSDHPKVMAHCCRFENVIAFAVHNFCQEPVTAKIHFNDLKTTSFAAVLGDNKCEFHEDYCIIDLKPYGFGWWINKTGDTHNPNG